MSKSGMESVVVELVEAMLIMSVGNERKSY